VGASGVEEIILTHPLTRFPQKAYIPPRILLNHHSQKKNQFPETYQPKITKAM
jgi:hypothetical protein